MNMQPMMDFSVFFLGALADFFNAEPVNYLFSLIMLAFFAKLFKTLGS